MNSQPYLKRFSELHLLVAGEVGIDQYLWGDIRRISPEAPVPVVEVREKTFRLGLSGNVAQNVAALRAKTTLVSVRGDDDDGRFLETMVESAGIARHEFIVDDSRPTLRKVRVLAQRQHVVRIDYERSHGLSALHAKRFVDAIEERLPDVDGVILQDYGKGLWTPDTMQFVRRARELGKPVFVDPSRNTPLPLYQGVSLLTPNLAETELLCRERATPIGPEGPDRARLTKLGKQLLEETGAEEAVITCSEWGMAGLRRDQGEIEQIPTFAREVADVTGAGDTVIAVIALMRAGGFSLPEAMHVANAAAGVVVARIGTSTASPDELSRELERVAT